MLLEEIASKKLTAHPFDKLAQQDMETLGYLIHDKGHVFKKHLKDESMEKALKWYSSKCKKPLYRGIRYKEVVQSVIDNKVIPFYSSFSEDINVAKKFGTVITLLPVSEGFCYWQFLSKSYDWYAKNYGEDEDEEFIKLEAEKEKEWIFPMQLRLEIVDLEKLIFKMI